VRSTETIAVFVEKLRVQFEPLPDQCWRLFADALFIYFLPSTFLKNKYEFIRDFLEQGLHHVALPVHEVADREVAAQGIVHAVEAALPDPRVVERGLAQGLGGNGAGIDAGAPEIGRAMTNTRPAGPATRFS
jgi:hypothetical protein